MASTQTATNTASNGKAKRRARNSGPMQITFVDANGKSDFKRVPAHCTGMRVAVGNKVHVYTVTDYPEQTITSLAFNALATRAKTQVANHGDDIGSNVFDLIDSVNGDFKSGKLYNKAEGGPRGKPFDAEMYADAYKQSKAWMAKRNVEVTVNGKKVPVKPLTDKEHADLVVWLQTATPDKRKQRTDLWAKNDVFRKMFATLKANKISIAEPVGFDDAF